MSYSLSISMLVIFLLFAGSGCANNNDEKNNAATPHKQTHDQYDNQLAIELGADNYGMRTYVMAFLKTGPDRNHDAETARELQRGHMENITRLANEGKLILAGPFLDGGELRGIFLFDVGSVEEARELTETDPAVQAGRLEMELHTWYGSAALLKVPEIHRRISKETP
jgi:uncharacterized protein